MSGGTEGTVEEKLKLVAGGAAIAILPRSTARFYRRQDVAFCVITELAPTAVHIAREASRISKHFTTFVDAAHSRPERTSQPNPQQSQSI